MRGVDEAKPKILGDGEPRTCAYLVSSRWTEHDHHSSTQGVLFANNDAWRGFDQ